MERIAIVQLHRFGPLVLDDFKEVLRLHGVKSGNEGCRNCKLGPILVFCVDQLWRYHIRRPVEKVNGATSLFALD